MIFLVNENSVLTHQTSKLVLFDQTGLSIGVGYRGRNGPGWADESQPMGYQTLAQPTHGRLI
jgi:hypothetical protein